MRKIILFMMVSVDGFFEGPGHDLSWHVVDEEFNDFASAQMKETDTILFGRRTYLLMESYWPTDAGRVDDPEVAKLMNETPKIVISQSLNTITETDIWKHVRLINNDVKNQIKKLKEDKGGDILLLASSNLCVSLLEWGLLDEIRLMISPVVIGKGTQLFKGVKHKIPLTLIKSRLFVSGNMLLTYIPTI